MPHFVDPRDYTSRDVGMVGDARRLCVGGPLADAPPDPSLGQCVVLGA